MSFYNIGAAAAFGAASALGAEAVRGLVIDPIKRAHERGSLMRAGALDFHRGSQHFYSRGIQVGGVKSGIINFFIDVAHLLLLAGGVYLLMTALFG